MKEELEHARRGIQPLPAGVERLRLPTQPARKAIREESDIVINDALRRDDLPGLCSGLAKLMLVIATAVDTYDMEPDVGDFVEAATALIEDGRAVLDRGLQLQQWPTAKCGSVMVEIAVRGIAAALNLPYSEILAAVAHGQDVTAVLVKSGHISPPENVGEQVAPPNA